MAQAPVPNGCSSHPKQVYQFYCENDDKLVCRLCVTDTHKGHHFTDLDVHVQIKRYELEQYVGRLNNKLSILNSEEEQTEIIIKKHKSLLRDILRKTEDLKTQVDQASSRLTEQQKKQHKTFKVDLEKCRQESKFNIERLMSDKQTIHEQLSHSNVDMLQWVLSNEFDQLCNEESLTSKPSAEKPLEHEFVSLSVDEKQIGQMIGSLKPVYFKHHSCSATEFQSLEQLDIKSCIDFKEKNSYSKHVGTVFTVDDDLSWIGFQKAGILKLVSKEGSEKINIDVGFVFKDMLVTPYSDIILSEESGSKLWKISFSNERQEYFDATPFETRGMGLTKTGDILLCLKSKEFCGKIVRLNPIGKVISEHEIDFTDEGVVCNNPDRILQNVNKDIVIIDSNVVLGLNFDMSKVKFRYQGSTIPGGQKPFMPLGIANDKFCHIYIADYKNPKIHVLDSNGKFLSFLSMNELEKNWPRRLAVSDEGLLWIGCNHAVVYTARLCL